MKTFRFIARILLGAALIFAGTSHLTFARATFQAQVPAWLPLDKDFVVIASGVVEISLGLGLLILFRYLPLVGILTALFFVAIFPGNISQYLTHTDAFGLNTDESRLIRLFFQPLLVLWALWSTGAMFSRFRSKNSRKGPRPLTDRERKILDLELAESARNPLVTPLDTTSSGDGIYGKAANILMNPAIRGGSTGNVGIPSQSLDETKGK
jgi:uncharacterized membrane protein